LHVHDINLDGLARPYAFLLWGPHFAGGIGAGEMGARCWATLDNVPVQDTDIREGLEHSMKDWPDHIGGIANLDVKKEQGRLRVTACGYKEAIALRWSRW
jgi:hypothetical protein